MPPTRLQTTDRILMVRPAAFAFNVEAAATNAMQMRPDDDAAAIHAAASDEFDSLLRALRSEGVRVSVAEDTPSPAKPDAIFPNNWVSFHADGTVVLYPMQTPSRRAERRPELIALAAGELGFNVSRTLDLSGHEREGRYLEGTGSLVLDHPGRRAYACRSARTDPELVRAWCEQLGYEPEIFTANDAAGRAYYHTNVMLSIGDRWAVICAESIAEADRERVLDALRASGREVLAITREQVRRFVGNVLEVATWDEAMGDSRVLVMSATAREALGAPLYSRLAAMVDSILAVPVPTIERVGGGGVRCMMAEVFAS